MGWASGVGFVTFLIFGEFVVFSLFSVAQVSISSLYRASIAPLWLLYSASIAPLWRTLRVTVSAGVDDMRDQGADGAALHRSLRRRAGPRRVGHHHPSHLKPLCSSTLQLTPWLLYSQSSVCLSHASVNSYSEP